MTKEEVIEKVEREAGEEFFCSKSVVYSINNLLGKPYDENIVMKLIINKLQTCFFLQTNSYILLSKD